MRRVADCTDYSILMMMLLLLLLLLLRCVLQRLVEQFQTDVQTRVAVLSIKAAGVVSSDVIDINQ